MNANDKEDIKEVCAGDIAAAVGLENTVTGDTFGDEKKPYLLEAIDFAEPVITQAIEPKTNEDRDRMRDALEKLKVQDPSFKYWIDKETGQMIIAGMGELHLEVCIERLRREYKLNIESKQQRVSYRETIKNRTENIVAEYKKQSGGSGHYAKIIVKFEPNPGKGFEFVNAVRGDGVPKNFAEATGKGIEETMFNGLLLGYPTVDVKVTLMDGKTHSVDSKELDFKEAAVIAFRGDGRSGKEERIKQMGSVLLEPIMNLEVIVPKDYMGDILANLASRRTVVESTDEKDGETYIKGKCPLKEMLSYSTTLRQLTKGRGSYSMSLSHYQEVPKDVFEEISKSEK
jgi:elongation factor G